MIKAVIFDIGGVLIRTEDRSPRSNLEKRLNLQPGEAEFLVYNSEMGQKAQQGLISAGEQWAWLQQTLKLSADEIQQFRQEFWGGDRVDQTLIELIRGLRPRYQIAIISNAMDDLLTFVIPQLDPSGGGELFDLIVGSAYARIMKPAATIFEQTLTQLGRQPAEAVFIDDMAYNITGARAVGMHAIHFQPGTDLAQELAQLGVSVGE